MSTNDVKQEQSNGGDRYITTNIIINMMTFLIQWIYADYIYICMQNGVVSVGWSDYDIFVKLSIISFLFDEVGNWPSTWPLWAKLVIIKWQEFVSMMYYWSVIQSNIIQALSATCDKPACKCAHNLQQLYSYSIFSNSKFFRLNNRLSGLDCISQFCV